MSKSEDDILIPRPVARPRIYAGGPIATGPLRMDKSMRPMQCHSNFCKVIGLGSHSYDRDPHIRHPCQFNFFCFKKWQREEMIGPLLWGSEKMEMQLHSNFGQAWSVNGDNFPFVHAH